VARTWAVGLALFAHGMSTFGGVAALGDASPFVQLLVRTATPTFVFMFGIMLELVYARRARDDGMRPVARRLLLRSAQCYLGYQLTVVAAVVGGYLTAGDGAEALVFLQKSRFGNILRFYSFAMLAAIPIIWLRLRSGPAIYAVLLVLVWAAVPALAALEGRTGSGPLGSWAGILFGIGEMKVGPSVWHGMTFTLAGMMIATTLVGFRSAAFSLRAFRRFSAGFVAICALIAGWLVFESSAFEVARAFAGFEYRSGNHIGYYAIGLIASTSTLVVLSIVVPVQGALAEWTRTPLALGTSSLLSFTAGNVILNLVPAPLVALGTGMPIAAALSVIGVVALLVSRPIVGRCYRSACSRPIHLRPPQGV
jgi:hypothetical protein